MRLRNTPFYMAVALSLCAVGMGTSCKKTSTEEEVPSAQPAVDTPVPAPAGLLAELVIAKPDAVWGRGRTMIGGPAAFLPQSIGGLVTTLLGMPITIAGEFDGEIPVVAAAVGTLDGPRYVAGVHVKVGEKIIEQLTKGQDARFVVKIDGPSKVRILEQKGDKKANYAIGILNNYLLVGKKMEDLISVGPYVARTLSKATPTKDDGVLEVPGPALTGTVVKTLRDAWDKIKASQGSEAAKFVPLDGTVQTILSVMSDASKARVTFTLDDAALHAKVGVTPQSGTGAAAAAFKDMSTGTALPVLDLPVDSVFALYLRESAAARQATANQYNDAVSGALGKDVSPADKESVLSFLRSLSEARGDWFLGGLTINANGSTAYLRSAAKDEEKFAKVMKDLSPLLQLAAVKAKLKEQQVTAAADKTKVDGVDGEVYRIKFEPQDKKMAAKANLPNGGVTELLYTMAKHNAFGAIGSNPAAGLPLAIAANEKDSLASVGLVKGFVQALGEEANFLLFADPLKLQALQQQKVGGDSGPVVLSMGRTGTDVGADSALWLRLDLAGAAVREYVQRKGLF